MKKRILSLVLALAMCLSVFTFGIAIEAATIGELMEIYKERIWDWQGYQFEAMTDEQTAVIDDAWTSYEGNKDAIRGVAEEFISGLLKDNTAFYSTDTMKDLYKWKLMRDIMEEKLEITNTDAEYVAWLADFTAFEEANDEAISASAPIAALNGLGSYSADLTVYFGELAGLGITFEGEGAEKATAYVDAFLAGDDLSAVEDTLKADVKELMVDGLVNGFDIGMQVATNQISRGAGLFDMIEDRDMKAAFLLVGEDLVRFAMDELVPGVRKQFLALPKDEIMTAVIGTATPILGADNEAAVDAIYDTMAALANYMLGDKMDKIEEAEAKLAELGFVIDEELVTFAKDKLQEAMGLVHGEHGLELVHMNTYLGRALLRYKDAAELPFVKGEKLPLLANAVINGDEVSELALGFGHNLYPVFSSLNELRVSVASFDATGDENGIKVYAANGDEDFETGQVFIEVTEEADGTATVAVYRGYTGEFDWDTEEWVTPVYDEDVYRYVTQFTVTATSDVVPETPYVTLEDVKDTTVDGTIEVKGTTNLDHVTVSVIKTVDGEAQTIYAVVYTKAEFEAGITLNAPDNAQEGDVYTVVVGTEKASASDEFAIEGAAVTYTVELEDVKDTTADGTIEVKGTTNLDYVTVAIVKTVDGEVQTVYAVVYTKAEFEEGIEIAAPDNAQEGDVYTVVVGTEKASASDEFEIVATVVPPVDYEITLEDIADFKLSDNENAEIVVKGTTNLDYVVVTITLGEDNVYAVTHTKAEFEAGITIAIDNAAVWNVYTVAVGQEGTEAEDTFEILPEEVVAPSGSLAVSGSTTRKVKVGKTTSITATPQNVAPADATVEIVWTTEDGGIIEVTEVTVDDTNNASIATITKLAKGTEKVTATLYVNGVAVDSKVITVKNPSTGGSGSATVKPDEPIVKPHECQWPDIAATATKPAHWAHETIDIMTINGYIKGYEDGTFKPDNNITRAEFSAIVYRILGLEVAEDGVLYDDTKGHWAEDIIATMSLPEGYGMLRGYGDGNFGPNDLITREQAVAIIARAKSAVWTEAEEGAKDVFTDAEDISWWFDGEMDAAVTNGLITGYEDGSYKPLEYTTRAEACVLLARAWPEILE